MTDRKPWTPRPGGRELRKKVLREVPGVAPEDLERVLEKVAEWCLLQSGTITKRGMSRRLKEKENG